MSPRRIGELARPILTSQIVGFLGPGLVFTCSAANNFVYSAIATVEAAGAGHILLSIIQVRVVVIHPFHFPGLTVV